MVDLNRNKTDNVREARLCNHYCSGKTIYKTYSVCVSAALDIQHAMLMGHIVIRGLPGL